MPREEITNSRPNNYGVFRRKCIREDILKYCYMVDAGSSVSGLRSAAGAASEVSIRRTDVLVRPR